MRKQRITVDLTMDEDVYFTTEDLYPLVEELILQKRLAQVPYFGILIRCDATRVVTL